ncbi:MAG: hypothetical protein QG580_134 [Patescibacteria group bacterium]|jgi:hypothetical protein|nr:hypothetical protein [Patescibacteria group bacterium]
MIEKVSEKVIYKKDNAPKIKHWTEEEISPLIGNMIILKETNNLKENPEDYKRRAIETFKEIHNLILDNGGMPYLDVSEIYNKYSTTNPLIVRREDPARLSRLINGEELKIYFDPNVAYQDGEKYANSALWPYGPEEKTNGIANAFLEGRGNAGPIVMLGGYSTEGKNISIVEPEKREEVVGTLNRHSVRILSGEISPEDLEFVIIRTAANFFDKSQMTEKELSRFQKGEQKQIFRGYYFKK